MSLKVTKSHLKISKSSFLQYIFVKRLITVYFKNELAPPTFLESVQSDS